MLQRVLEFTEREFYSTGGANIRGGTNMRIQDKYSL
jgi:hypothetical protein